MDDIKMGTKFIRRGRKRKDIETVIDKLVTKNLAGEVVEVRYVSTHAFMGQEIVTRDNVAATIRMGQIK